MAYILKPRTGTLLQYTVRAVFKFFAKYSRKLVFNISYIANTGFSI